MNIGFFISNHHIGHGGVETVTALLSDELRSRQHTTYLFLTEPMDFPDPYSHFSHTIISAPIPACLRQRHLLRPRALYRYYQQRAYRSLSRQAADCQLDVLLLINNAEDSLRRYGEIMSFRKQSPQTRVFFYPHGTLNKVMHSPYMPDFLSAVDGMLAISTGIAHEMRQIKLLTPPHRFTPSTTRSRLPRRSPAPKTACGFSTSAASMAASASSRC